MSPTNEKAYKDIVVKHMSSAPSAALHLVEEAKIMKRNEDYQSTLCLKKPYNCLTIKEF